MNKMYEQISDMCFFVNLAIFPDIVVRDSAEAPGMGPGTPRLRGSGGCRGGLG